MDFDREPFMVLAVGNHIVGDLGMACQLNLALMEIHLEAMKQNTLLVTTS